MVMAMAAVDKILHESFEAFVSLAKKGKLDGFVDLELSKSIELQSNLEEKRIAEGFALDWFKDKKPKCSTSFIEIPPVIVGLQSLWCLWEEENIREYGRTFKPKRSSKRLQKNGQNST